MKKRASKLTALLLAGSMILTVGGSTVMAEESAGKDTMTIGLTALGELDPMSWTTANQLWFHGLIFDSLIDVNTMDLSIEPELATAWEYSEDGTELTFTIREDAVFHNGDPVKATDIAYSINTAIASPYLAGHLLGFTGAEATDEKTVVVRSEAYNFSSLTSLAYVYVVPEALYSDENAVFAENLVGSGPFMAGEMDSVNKNYTLNRNDAYWDEASALKEITFREISDASTMVVALEKGEIDICRINATEYNTVSANEDLVIETTQQNVFAYLAMNTELAPFDNVLVRQAINYALDRESIMQVSTGGVNATAASVLCDDAWGFDTSSVTAYEYNPEKAMALLEEAGITTPLDLGELTIIQQSKGIAEMVQQNLAAVGINVSIVQTEVSDWLNTLYSGDFLLGLMGSCEVGIAALGTFAGTDSINGMNLSRYSNEEMDKAIDVFYSARETEDINANGAALVQMIQEEALYGTLYKSGSCIAHNKDLQVEVGNVMFVNFAECYWN